MQPSPGEAQHLIQNKLELASVELDCPKCQSNNYRKHGKNGGKQTSKLHQ